MTERSETTEQRRDSPILASWEVEIEVGPCAAELAERLVHALGPESGEGVPRTHVEVHERSPGLVGIHLLAPSTSSVRAALNAHLRWVDLALRVDHLARATGPARQDGAGRPS